MIQNDAADGVKEHRFIRAETHPTKDDAAAFAFTKGKQIIDQQGDRVFGDVVFGSSVPAAGWPSA